MMTKVLVEILWRLVMLIPSGVSLAWKKFNERRSRQKKHKELEQKAQKVEDAKTHDEVRVAADDLP